MPKNITPKDTKYVPLTQQKWCCVPICVQMVMVRHNIPLVPSELIGYHMGLVVPEDAQQYFWNTRTGPKPPAGYGTQSGEPQHGPNAVFKKLNIPFKMSWNLINKFKDLDSFRTYLSKVSESNKDILVCYDWPTLFSSNEKDHWGHVCVLDKVDMKNDQIRIIDPSAHSAKWVVIGIPKMYEAMVFHTKENSGGFWEIAVKKK